MKKALLAFLAPVILAGCTQDLNPAPSKEAQMMYQLKQIVDQMNRSTESNRKRDTDARTASFHHQEQARLFQQEQQRQQQIFQQQMNMVSQQNMMNQQMVVHNQMMHTPGF